MSSKFENSTILISSLKQGDEEAYRYLVKTYHKLLFNYAISLTNDRAMAQDVIQEVFMNIWRDRKKLHESYNLKNYIYKITYNKFINQYHKNRAISSIERAYMEALNESVDDNNAELLERKIALVTEGIANLPKKCKETFLLSKKEGLTNIEIAEYQNISIKTVEGHLTKAYSLLRERVGEQLKHMLFLLFKKGASKL
ncbi:sigma-70 family RNA polymerase sigma factor [Seonamhaeicola sp.]|uniref:RNA polymerase sigma factor n=1 Tax=Seonamhaeicola sp. TaxID=1912245 RepID=UPI0026165E2A|nr:sigma-70 family RNA polymerase sigma factor [Seonamhaeicola sp.]